MASRLALNLYLAWKVNLVDLEDGWLGAVREKDAEDRMAQRLKGWRRDKDKDKDRDGLAINHASSSPTMICASDLEAITTIVAFRS